MKIRSLYRWYVLAILVLVYTTNIADRFVLSILIEPIRAEFGVSDTALGLLGGFAFVVFYTLMGLPIARLADRGNRRNIIALSVGIYSIMTALCGAAQGFFHLLLARIGVGVGEAGSSPPSHSLIADLFHISERTFALAVLSLGASIGLTLGFSGGGWIAEHYGWRSAFFAMAIPGMIVAVLVRLTVSEPEQRIGETVMGEDTKGYNMPGLADTLKFIASQKAYVHVVFGGALLNAYLMGMTIFLPAVLVRSHGFSVSEAGHILGWVLGISGSLGLIVGGYLTDYLGRRDFRWHPWLTAWVTIITLPGSVGLLLLNKGILFYVCVVMFGIANSMFLGPLFAMAQNLVAPRMRALAAALLLFIINIIGAGLGPQIVGIFSDLLRAFSALGEDSLRYALLLGIVVTGPWSVYHYFRGARTIQEDYARAAGT